MMTAYILLLIVQAFNLFCAIQSYRHAKRAEVAAKAAEERSYNEFVRKYGYAPY